MGTDDGQHDVRAVTRRDHLHPVVQPLQHVLGRHARHQKARRLPAQQIVVATDQRAVHGFAQLGDRRGHQQRLLRQHVALQRLRLDPRQSLGDGLHLLRVAAVGHHRCGVRVLARDLGKAQFDDVRDLVGRTVLGPHRQHHRRAEVDRDARVGAQLAWRGDVGVVAADDDHRIALFGHPVEAVDDVGERGVRVLVQLGIADAYTVLVGQTRRGVREQQFEDVIAVLVQPGDGPEHPHLGDRGREPVQDAQRDRRLAGVTLWRRDVDGGRIGHARQPAVSAQPTQRRGPAPTSTTIHEQNALLTADSWQKCGSLSLLYIQCQRLPDPEAARDRLPVVTGVVLEDRAETGGGSSRGPKSNIRETKVALMPRSNAPTTKLSTGNGFPDVVVTGVALTTSVGSDAESTWKLLLDGQSGIRRLEDPFVKQYDLPVRIGGHLLENFDGELTRVELRRLGYVQKMATVLGRRVWDNAGSPEVDTNRLAVSIGTGIGATEALVFAYDDMRERGYKAVSPLAVQMFMPNGPAAAVGLERHAKAGVMTAVSACASVSEGIAQAWRQIILGEADIAICGGVENSIEAVPIAAFAQMRIVM